MKKLVKPKTATDLLSDEMVIALCSYEGCSNNCEDYCTFDSCLYRCKNDSSDNGGEDDILF